jgi:hypothetical protein
VAEQLAAQSDAVADAIAANDGCAAAAARDDLRATLDEAAVPEAIRAEVEPFALREFACAPPPPPPVPPPPPAETYQDGEGDGDGDDD